ncbi:MAG TPA: LuxR C-terminal-related transcriptional regulator [Alphaproteobacteria bacterium]|nr:LuxR C-terminal-related transcriptional regulator [Alphaproteobacteria bacterium]
MSTLRRPGRPRYDDALTPAEWRVADAVRHGGTDRTIAGRLGISPDAVKFHVGNILGKLGLDSRAALRHWTGVPRASALSRAQEKGETMTEPTDGAAWGTLGQVARTVREIGPAETWFRDVLGLPHLYTFGNLAFFDCGGVRLMLSAGEGTGQDSVLYFRVPDIHAAWQRLLDRGAKAHSAPHVIHTHADGTEEWMAFVDDNEGRPIGIMCQVSPAG